MSDTASALQRYQGRYLMGREWRDGVDISRFLEVTVEGDTLVARTETTSFPVAPGRLAPDDPAIERRSGQNRDLTFAGDHTFTSRDDVYRFDVTDGASVRVTLTKPGAEPLPCPRFVPLPEPSRVDDTTWIDLGHATICMTATDLDALAAFYQRLGFAPSRTDPRLLRHGWSKVAFLDFQVQPCLNFRGPSVVDTAFELAHRGYEISDGRLPTRDVQGDGAGSFMVYDPDGHRTFFNTHPYERDQYDAWVADTLPEAKGVEAWDVGAPPDVRAAASAPLPLGDLCATLDTHDLDASVDFYRGFGCEIMERSNEDALVSPRSARSNRFAFPIRLQRAVGDPRFSFGFLCSDPDSAAAEVTRRGVEVIESSGGPAFEDPDGNVIGIYPAR